MSSLTSKELLAKNLQKSHSSSSILLSSANLSWTPSTGSAILVTPQPSLERAISPSNSDSSKTQTNEELIQTLRLDSKTNSNQSIDVLDGFQTISLNDTKSDDNSDHKSIELNSSTTEKKLSLLDQLFSTVGVGLSSQSTTTASDASPLVRPSLTTSPVISEKSGHLSGSYSTPNFDLLQSNTNQSISRSSSVQSIPTTNPVPPLLPPQLPAPPQLPPPPPVDAFVPKSYKIRGPLRLYDPNHGFVNPSAASNSSVAPVSTFTPPELTPISETLLLNNPNEGLYNPNDYFTNTSIETNVSSSGSTQTNDSNIVGQQFGTTVTSEGEPLNNYGYNLSENSNEFSFISQTPNQESYNYLSNSSDFNPSGQTSEQSNSEQLYYQSMSTPYQPLVHHWFYQKIIESKEVWIPFSMYDSYNLEQAVLSSGANNGYGVVIPTNGGRFDVSVYERLRRPVYWSEADTIVRRCSWFYKMEGHNTWVPYTEEFSVKLEDSYRDAVLNNNWNQKIEFESGAEIVVMHSRQSIYHYQSDHLMPDGWGQALENPVRPRIVHRGALDGIFVDIDEGEPEQIDHLLFLIHGIGEICDFSFRSIVEVVDDFRIISLSQMRTQFKPYLESGQLGRIEMLPISWHSALHGEETGIDDRLKQITLESIPKLRHFSNDTVLDALFYTSPVYCQTIIDNVGQELNRLFALFCQRNTNFCGTVALGGHSLGSLIVFDILAHQFSDEQNKVYETPGVVDIQSSVESTNVLNSEQQIYEYFSEPMNQTLESLTDSLGFAEYLDYLQNQKRLDFKSIIMLSKEEISQRLELPIGLETKLINFIQNFNNFLEKQRNERKMSQSSNELQKLPNSPINYPFESLGLGFPAIKYPTLAFKPSALFAMGSPIPMFLTVRGVELLSPDYRLPTCPAVYNIFHPYDPIAYRLEPMIYRTFKDIKPVLIPHHKGRKRMHLELKESIARMGSDIKSKIYDSLKYTWNSINEFARAHKSNPQMNTSEVDTKYSESSDANDFQNSDSNQSFNNSNNYTINEIEDSYGQSLSAGALNSGRRIDYVLQESPVEAFNEYLFAIRAHACYWSSEDTALLILRELYGQLGFYSTPAALQQQSIEPTVSSSASNHSFDLSSSFDLNEQQFR